MSEGAASKRGGFRTINLLILNYFILSIIYNPNDIVGTFAYWNGIESKVGGFSSIVPFFN